MSIDHSAANHALTRRHMIGRSVAFAATPFVLSAAARPARAGENDDAVDVALVGGAHIHAPGFVNQMRDHPRINTRYVWDPDPDTARRRQEVTGGDIVDDLDTIWQDDEVKAAIVLSQTVHHKRLISEAVAAGKHVFHDKPLGMDGEEADQLARQINEADVIYQTGYFQRGEPQHRYVRELVSEGRLGEITRIRTSMEHSGAIGGWFDGEWRWMADREQAGVGGFGDLGTHALDRLLDLMTAADDKAVAATGHVDAVLERYEGTDEYGVVMIRFESGAIGTVEAGWVSRANPNTLEISGTEGLVYINRGRVFVHGAGVENGQPVENLPEGWPHPFQLFLQAITNEAEAPLISADEAAYGQRVMTAIYKGAENMQWVEL